MKRPIRTFDSLSENLQEKMHSWLVEKYTLQGQENPTKLAWRKIKEQKPQSKKAWQRLLFFTMQAIDKSLVAKGLPPKHFPTQR